MRPIHIVEDQREIETAVSSLAEQYRLSFIAGRIPLVAPEIDSFRMGAGSELGFRVRFKDEISYRGRNPGTPRMDEGTDDPICFCRKPSEFLVAHAKSYSSTVNVLIRAEFNWNTAV